jgi:hypothetical protein
MPEPDSYTPIQRLRAPKERWDRFGETVGNRSRSAELNAYMEARIAGTDHQVLLRALMRWIAADPDGAFAALAPYLGKDDAPQPD